MLIEQIKSDLDTARKEHDKFKVALLTTLYSDIQMIGKNALRDTSELEAVSIVKKFVNGVDETLALLTYSDEHKVLREKLTQEKAILSAYVPTQLDEQELKIVINNAITNGVITMKLPLIMKFLKDMYPGQYDGALASKIAKELLA
jgi:hypothetical protein